MKINQNHFGNVHPWLSSKWRKFDSKGLKLCSIISENWRGHCFVLVHQRSINFGFITDWDLSQTETVCYLKTMSSWSDLRRKEEITWVVWTRRQDSVPSSSPHSFVYSQVLQKNLVPSLKCLFVLKLLPWESDPIAVGWQANQFIMVWKDCSYPLGPRGRACVTPHRQLAASYQQ